MSDCDIAPVRTLRLDQLNAAGIGVRGISGIRIPGSKVTLTKSYGGEHDGILDLQPPLGSCVDTGKGFEPIEPGDYLSVHRKAGTRGYTIRA